MCENQLDELQADETLNLIGVFCETAAELARFACEFPFEANFVTPLYTSRRDGALELANELTCTQKKDAAFDTIIELLIEAAETGEAQGLYHTIEDAEVREGILERHPSIAVRH